MLVHTSSRCWNQCIVHTRVNWLIRKPKRNTKFWMNKQLMSQENFSKLQVIKESPLIQNKKNRKVIQQQSNKKSFISDIFEASLVERTNCLSRHMKKCTKNNLQSNLIYVYFGYFFCRFCYP